MKWVYQCFGITKQAFYQRRNANTRKEIEAIKIKDLIATFRKEQPRLGITKLHLDMKEGLKRMEIKMGRDKLFTFARNHDLLIRKTKQYHITTDSKHFFYKSPNLIKNMLPTMAEQVFVSDITYIRLDGKYAYLALVTDLYSKKIMGYACGDNMKVGLVKEALQMALNNCVHNRETIIHHSDRGIQYCCPDYSEFAKQKGMILSTTEKYDPYENAVAERINGILKYEFGLRRTIPNLQIAQKMIRQSIETYNNKRRHRSLEMKTPNFAHVNQQHNYVSYKRGVDERVEC